MSRSGDHTPQGPQFNDICYMKKLLLCDYDAPENNYNYRCPKLSSDDWDENHDPCIGCSHKIFKYIEV